MLIICWIESIIIHEYFIFIGNVIQKYETTSFVSFSYCFSLFQLYLVLLLPFVYAFLVQCVFTQVIIFNLLKLILVEPLENPIHFNF